MSSFKLTNLPIIENNTACISSKLIPIDSTYKPQYDIGELVCNKVKQYTQYALEDVEVNDLWSIIHQEGDMKVYRRELNDKDGIVIDPLRASHTVEGVTAYELISLFFNPETRLAWDNTLESSQSIEKLDDVTFIYNSIHKRVWPAAQRQSVFCSHLSLLSQDILPNEKGIGPTYQVVNFSVDHPKAQVSSKLVRVKFNISLTCQSYIDNSVLLSNNGDFNSIPRSDIKCKMIYTAEIHPGGWVPPTAVRNIGKRELTKFLIKIGTFAQNYSTGKQLVI